VCVAVTNALAYCVTLKSFPVKITGCLVIETKEKKETHLLIKVSPGRHNIQHNDTQLNDIQHNV
jgi:hypothetical protein